MKTGTRHTAPNTMRNLLVAPSSAETCPCATTPRTRTTMVPSTSPDPVTVLGHLFLGGGDLPAPGAQTCGVDPTVDSLGCVGTTGCALP